MEFVEALRFRLGAAGPNELVPCARCGSQCLDASGSHALCCATNETTRGHYTVSSRVLSAVQQCDPAAESETPGLIPGTALRPADVLTSALGNGLTALDIGITSPDAQNAGSDCVASMFERKLAYYAPHQRALESQGIDYYPLIWSAYGRPHSQTTAALRIISQRIARRKGLTDWRQIYSHIHSGISTEIWRRAAKSVAACWPGRVDDWLGHD